MGFGKQELFRIKHTKKGHKGVVEFCLVMNAGELYRKLSQQAEEGTCQMEDPGGFSVSVEVRNPGSGEQKVVRTSVYMIVPICLSTPWLEFYLPEYSPSQGLNSRQQGMGGAGTVIVLYCKCSRG